MRFVRRHRLGLAVGGTIAAALVATTAFADSSVTVGQEEADALRSAAGSTGAVVTARDGETITDFGSGTTSFGKKDAPGGDDRFRVASNTKMYVSTVVLQLVEEKKLALDDPIGEHLPGVVVGDGIDENKITVRQLLQHTSGLGDNLTIDVMLDPRHQINPPSLEKMAEIGMKQGSAFDPGTDWKYSNTGYTVLGLLIEKLTGTGVGDAIDERVVQPLGLQETGFADPGEKEIKGDHFRGYLGINPVVVDVSNMEPGVWSSAGALVSSGSDMTIFTDGLMRGELLGEDMMKEMQTTYKDSGYGLGLAQMELECGTVWGHTGHVLGYMSFTFSDAEGHSAFAAFNTSALGLNDVMTPVTTAMNKAICGTDSKQGTFSDSIVEEFEDAAEEAEAVKKEKSKD